MVVGDRKSTAFLGSFESTALAKVLVAALVCMLMALSSAALAQQTVRADPGEVGRLLDALSDARADIAKDSFLSEEALFATDLSPEGVFAWVRDSTRLVPYRGALRGPTGVLQDRAGNSLDRALLLQDLLDGLGYDTRLARATLPDGVAAGLLASIRTAPLPESPAPDGSLEPAVVDALIAAYGLDRELVEDAVALTLKRSRELSQRLEERSRSQSELIASLLGLATLAADPDHDATLIGALRDHWWLQYQDGAAWIDLDPSLPGHEAGDALADPVELVEAFGVSGLPRDLLHTLSVSVVLECVEGGALSEHTLVATEPLVAASISGLRSSVSVIPVGLGARDPANLTELVEGLLAEKHWLPTVTFGDDSLSDLEFSPDCNVGPLTPPWLGGAISDALGSALDALFGEEPKGESVSALRIEYVIGSPGADDLVLRRDLFDNLGPAKRERGDLTLGEDDADRLAWRLRLVGETEILVTASALSQEFVLDRAASALLAAGPQLVELAGTGAVTSAVQPAAVAPGALYGLALARQSLMPGPAYFGAANVVQRHDWLATAGGGIVQRQAFDFVSNRVESYAQAAEARAHRLIQGVIDTNAETLIEAQLCEDSATATFCQVTPNPGDQLAASDGSAGWSVIRTAGEAATALAAWPPDARARLTHEVEAGYAVLVDAAAGSAGGAPASWWRIDLLSGSALGVNALGYGASAAEYAMIVNFIGFAFCEYGALTGSAPVAGTTMCAFGFATGTGAVIASGVGAAVGVAGVLAIASAILYGLGGIGVGGG